MNPRKGERPETSERLLLILKLYSYGSIKTLAANHRRDIENSNVLIVDNENDNSSTVFSFFIMSTEEKGPSGISLLVLLVGIT